LCSSHDRRRGSVRVRERSVAGQILLLQVLTGLLVVAVAVALAYLDARRDQRDSARLRSVDIAETVADAPDVIAALDDPEPSAAIQPFDERYAGTPAPTSSS
jgi:two-component system, CitB family, sensor kinase